MNDLARLNELRQLKGISPLKSWKASKQALADAIAKLDPMIIAPAPVVIDPVRVAAAERKAEIQMDLEDAIKNAPVTKCPPAAALQTIQKRNKDLDDIATQRVKGDATAVKLPAQPKAKPVVKAPTISRKASAPGVITLAEIARELGLDPKIARAKMRRIQVPADILVGKHAYLSKAKAQVVELLQKDLRKS